MPKTLSEGIPAKGRRKRVCPCLFLPALHLLLQRGGLKCENIHSCRDTSAPMSLGGYCYSFSPSPCWSREASKLLMTALDDPRHTAFTEEAKLANRLPGHCAKPRRKSGSLSCAPATQLRARMELVSLNLEGIIKAQPLLRWSSKQLHEYEYPWPWPQEVARSAV